MYIYICVYIYVCIYICIYITCIFTFASRMPLPDYGHHNAEKKTHQDMVGRQSSSPRHADYNFHLYHQDHHNFEWKLIYQEEDHDHSIINPGCNFQQYHHDRHNVENSGHPDRGFHFHTVPGPRDNYPRCSRWPRRSSLMTTTWKSSMARKSREREGR